MVAADGKLRVTDVVDTEQLLRLVQSILSPKVEPFKQWLENRAARLRHKLCRFRKKWYWKSNYCHYHQNSFIHA